MGHYDKLYQKIKNNPCDVRFSDLEKLMTKVGGFDSKKGKGDHYVFVHPDLIEQISVDSRGKHKPLKRPYVENSIKAFDKCNPDFLKED